MGIRKFGKDGVPSSVTLKDMQKNGRMMFRYELDLEKDPDMEIFLMDSAEDLVKGRSRNTLSEMILQLPPVLVTRVSKVPDEEGRGEVNLELITGPVSRKHSEILLRWEVEEPEESLSIPMQMTGRTMEMGYLGEIALCRLMATDRLDPVYILDVALPGDDTRSFCGSNILRLKGDAKACLKDWMRRSGIFPDREEKGFIDKSDAQTLCLLLELVRRYILDRLESGDRSSLDFGSLMSTKMTTERWGRKLKEWAETTGKPLDYRVDAKDIMELAHFADFVGQSPEKEQAALAIMWRDKMYGWLKNMGFDVPDKDGGVA